MFIVLEGIDGSGKTTQAKLLADVLRQRGLDVVLTFEPTKGFIGKSINEILHNGAKVDATALHLLFLADRVQHVVDEIRPALLAGKTVICDRYQYSTLAYGRAYGSSDEVLQSIKDLLPAPDLVIFVDVAPEQALARVDSRGGSKSIFEKKERLEKIYEQYKRLIVEGFLQSVDGNGTVDEVSQRIQKMVFDKIL